MSRQWSAVTLRVVQTVHICCDCVSRKGRRAPGRSWFRGPGRFTKGPCDRDLRRRDAPCLMCPGPVTLGRFQFFCVCVKSARDRHPSRQVLILFQLGRRTSMVFFDGATGRIAGGTRRVCLCSVAGEERRASGSSCEDIQGWESRGRETITSP